MSKINHAESEFQIMQNISWPKFLSSHLDKSSDPLMIVTVIETKGSTPREIGAKMIVSKQGLIFGTIGGGQLEFKVIEMAQELLSKKAQLISKSFALSAHMNQCCGGMMEILFEPIYPAPNLTIFGAGHVARELIYLLKPFRFNLLIVDDRLDLTDELKSHFENIQVTTYQQWQKKISSEYYLIMTHSHDLDFEILLKIHQSIESMSPRFIGLIGSISKWNNFKKKLQNSSVDEKFINRVECPIGIKMADKSPAVVALNILSRLIEVSDH